MPFPTYTISTDTADGKLHESKLATEIEGAGLTRPSNVGRAGDSFTITGTYTAPEQATIDGLVAAHTGARQSIKRIHSWSIFDAETEITLPSTWQHMGGRVITPDDWMPDLSLARFRFSFSVKATGGGATILPQRMTGAPVPLCAVAYSVPDTSGAWTEVEFDTDIAIPSGRGTFCICAQLDGATSAFVRYGSITLIRVKTI